MNIFNNELDFVWKVPKGLNLGFLKKGRLRSPLYFVSDNEPCRRALTSYVLEWLVISEYQYFREILEMENNPISWRTNLSDEHSSI